MKEIEMEYKLHWLIVGLFVLWIVEFFDLISNIDASPQIIIVLTPLLFWGLCSLFDYILTSKGEGK